MMIRPASLLVSAVLLSGAFLSPAFAADPKPVHAIAMHGDAKYPAKFDHFDYADPKAPKGGDMRFGVLGTFDSLNPFILKGTPSGAVAQTFDTLTVQSLDEAFTRYGLIAETMEMPEDRSWIIFNLRPEARFQDGSPITADDVVWTFDTLKSKGHPRYRSYYADVVKAEALSPKRVKFSFKGDDNRELPLIIGEMPVLSKAYYAKAAFDQTTLEAPLGSGPYKVVKVDAGKSVTLERVKDYWGRDLAVNKGRFNVDLIRYDYYRDDTVLVEALKAGEYDLRNENIARNWATSYDIPAVTQGQMVKEEIPNQNPNGMQGFAFNLRNPKFQDPKVREALGYAFDFERANKTLFYGLYTRTASYFSNSELAARGLPQGEELKILEKYRGKIPDRVFTQEYMPPVTDGSGNMRENLRTGLRLLQEAGWTVKDNKLVDKSGQVMEFEILLPSASFERVTLPYIEDLKRLGVNARARTVDPAQYQKRMEAFDYEVTLESFGQSISPGNEQRDYWSSASAAIDGSRNTMGIKDPVIDELVDLVITAPDRDSLIQRTRALDRVLQWGFYVVPHWHSRVYRVVHWNIFGHPATPAKYGLALDTWWIDKAKLATATLRKPGLTQP